MVRRRGHEDERRRFAHTPRDQIDLVAALCGREVVVQQARAVRPLLETFLHVAKRIVVALRLHEAHTKVGRELPAKILAAEAKAALHEEDALGDRPVARAERLRDFDLHRAHEPLQTAHLIPRRGGDGSVSQRLGIARRWQPARALLPRDGELLL